MRVFIGSSKESLADLREVAIWIEEAGLEAVPWDNPTLFPIGEHTFKSLNNLTKQVDGAVFIFGEDDALWYRGDTVQQPRDNVLIEYGLFTGALGPRKAIICMRGSPKTAADLQGITHVDINNKARAQLQIHNWAKSLAQQEESRGAPDPPRLWRGREFMRPTFQERMESTRSEMFLVGFSFETLFKDYKDLLRDMLNKNPKLSIRVLMTHPDSPHISGHTEFSDRDPRESIFKVVEIRLKSLFDELSAEAKRNLDVRVTYYMPRFAARIYDRETMVLNFYLFGKKAHGNPVIELSRRKQPHEFSAIYSSLENLFYYGERGGIKPGGHPNRKIIEDGSWKGF